jgi:DNA helicase-2/ATP-dependent DNA helicase PcrA
LISHNKDRLGKTLWTAQTGGEKVTICGLWDENEEARYVADEVESAQRKGIRLDHMAVLVRAGFQTRAFEERFLQLAIPYKVVGGLRFYERQEIRDALAYLRLIAQPNDNLAFERIVNVPKRGVGQASVQQLQVTARAQGVSLLEGTRRMVESDELKPALRRALSHFVVQISHWHDLSQTLSPSALAKQVLEEVGYVSMWQNDTSPDASGRAENLKEFVVALEEFDTLIGFLEHVSLVMENASTQGEEMVTLMTLHSAKGLEFDVVFLPGWEEGLFPHAKSLEEKGDQGLEEERRLAYVGITRAKTKDFITYTANRRIHNLRQTSLPSRFINDLPAEHVDALSRGHTQWSRPVHQSNYKPRSDYVTVSYVEDHLDEPAFLEGERVFHIKFGYGRVHFSQGIHVTVVFEHAGEKKVMANYLERA